MKKNILERFFSYKNPARLFLNLYLIIIFLATIVLMMPFSSANGSFTGFIDALFTAVSAICVTGLSTLTTAVHWSAFGKTFIIFLIQLGGLGVMTASSLVFLVLNKKMSISDRIGLSEEKNTVSISGIIKLIKFILISTFVIEAVGAVLLSFTFVPEFGFLKGILFSIFHSISAFCNAGFDLIGESSLMPYAVNININLVISILILLGGLGHKVIYELLEKKLNFKKYSVHTKLVAILTIGLLFVPAVFFLIIEWNNPETIGNYPFASKVLMSIFQSQTLRTAGFYSTNQAGYLNASFWIMLVLMFIGGSPAGTAGGFKTTTIASLFLITKANLRKEKDITIFKRRLNENIVSKVVSLFTISLLWIFGAILVLTISDPGLKIDDIIYEVFSAYGTVGLTRGITTSLSFIGKIVIALTMIFGKIGPISIVLAFMKKEKPKEYREIEENIIIG